VSEVSRATEIAIIMELKFPKIGTIAFLPDM
jgi:hypothetical protein